MGKKLWELLRVTANGDSNGNCCDTSTLKGRSELARKQAKQAERALNPEIRPERLLLVLSSVSAAAAFGLLLYEYGDTINQSIDGVLSHPLFPIIGGLGITKSLQVIEKVLLDAKTNEGKAGKTALTTTFHGVRLARLFFSTLGAIYVGNLFLEQPFVHHSVEYITDPENIRRLQDTMVYDVFFRRVLSALGNVSWLESIKDYVVENYSQEIGEMIITEEVFRRLFLMFDNPSIRRTVNTLLLGMPDLIQKAIINYKVLKAFTKCFTKKCIIEKISKNTL